MTETFRASNGARIEIHDSRIDIKCTGDSGEQHFLSSKETEAAREFFQHERDEELGRWRYPGDPRYVVYGGYSPGENKRIARVVNEQTGIASVLYEGKDRPSEVHDIAVAYFDAHPERKPWEAATYKDVWIWTTADSTQEALGWVAGDGTWDIITPKGDGIKAAKNPIVALVDAGFEKFSGAVTGVKRTPEDAS